jgi:hypothetical protein
MEQNDRQLPLPTEITAHLRPPLECYHPTLRNGSRAPPRKTPVRPHTVPTKGGWSVKEHTERTRLGSQPISPSEAYSPHGGSAAITARCQPGTATVCRQTPLRRWEYQIPLHTTHPQPPWLRSAATTVGCSHPEGGTKGGDYRPRRRRAGN